MNNRMQQRVEAWFDGETAVDAPATPQAEAHAAYLAKVRKGAETRKAVPEIRDEQFDAFMSGIREGIQARPASRFSGGFWALASAAAAAVIVATSAMIVFTGGPAPVQATEVEAYSTELEGATVDVETSEDGGTVWITVTTEDLW